MGGSVGKFAEGVAKAGAKAATTAALTYAIPIFGPFIAMGLNSLYAEGGPVKPFDVDKINDKVKAIAPDDAKFKVINSPEALKKAIQDFPVEAKKAGLTIDKVDAAVAKMEEQKAVMAKGGVVAKREAKMLKAMKSGAESGAVGMKPVKAKKERTPAQKAATAKMLAGLKAYKDGKGKK
jgi:hypothetical protein